jgi:hypothetical protein
VRALTGANEDPAMIKRWLHALTLALALGGGSAQGAVYTGIWDPPFGAPFDGLGWRGSARFDVPDFCVPGGTIDIGNLAACDGLARVDGAQVELYEVGSQGEPTLATLLFNPAALVIDTLRYVNGELTQLTTSLSDPVPPADPGGVVPQGVFFFLQFTLDGPRLGWSTCRQFGDPDCRSGFNDGVQFPPQFRISRVPEPASLALAALALAALAVLRRRQPRRRALPAATRKA